MNDPSKETRPVLILGIGNVLMGDEGVGIHLIRRLEAVPLPAGVDLLDGGTAGFELMSWIERYDRVILIDATLDGAPPGTICLREPRFSEDFPKSMSTHDIGLKDLVEGMSLLGKLPRMYLFTVSIEAIQPMQLTLSPAVEEALVPLHERVRSLAESLLTGKAITLT